MLRLATKAVARELRSAKRLGHQTHHDHDFYSKTTSARVGEQLRYGEMTLAMPCIHRGGTCAQWFEIILKTSQCVLRCLIVVFGSCHDVTPRTPGAAAKILAG